MSSGQTDESLIEALMEKLPHYGLVPFRVTGCPSSPANCCTSTSTRASLESRAAAASTTTTPTKRSAPPPRLGTGQLPGVAESIPGPEADRERSSPHARPASLAHRRRGEPARPIDVEDNIQIQLPEVPQTCSVGGFGFHAGKRRFRSLFGTEEPRMLGRRSASRPARPSAERVGERTNETGRSLCNRPASVSAANSARENRRRHGRRRRFRG